MEPSLNAMTDDWVPKNRIVMSMTSIIHAVQITDQKIFFGLCKE
jgi:hypothetical protein